MRESWTDDRLDDLNGKVDALRMEMKTDIGSLRQETNARFDRLETRFDQWQRAQLQIGGGLIVALLGIIGVILTRL